MISIKRRMSYITTCILEVQYRHDVITELNSRVIHTKIIINIQITHLLPNENMKKSGNKDQSQTLDHPS